MKPVSNFFTVLIHSHINYYLDLTTVYALSRNTVMKGGYTIQYNHNNNTRFNSQFPG